MGATIAKRVNQTSAWRHSVAVPVAVRTARWQHVGAWARGPKPRRTYRVGTDLKGENALSGGVTNDFGWDQIDDAFERWGHLGLTVLRMGDVAEGTDSTRYAEFIAKRR